MRSATSTSSHAAPWGGPVRVIDATPPSVPAATLAGHLEAGQIEFRAGGRAAGWASGSNRGRGRAAVSNLLYHRLRMAKEIQLHMWTSVLERVAQLTGGAWPAGSTSGRGVWMRVERFDGLYQPLRPSRRKKPVPGGSWAVARRIVEVPHGRSGDRQARWDQDVTATSAR